MSIIFTNGAVWTGTGKPCDWVRVEEGRVAEMGVGRPPQGTTYDLGGRALLPGFQDAHVHPPIGGLAMIRCDLHDLEGLDSYLAAIAAYARDHPDDPWIIGGGWPMNAFEGGIADKRHLDALVPDRPVLMHSSEGHAAWVNSAALAAAGIDAATPDPAHGRIERDADGVPNGTLQEGAVDLVTAVAPDDTVDDLVRGILAAQEYLLSLGITGWQDAWVRPVDHLGYRALDASGALLARVVGAMWWDRERGTDQLDELLARTTEAGNRYRPIGIKLMVDGVIENGTGAVCSPYLDTGSHGLTFLPRDLLIEIVPRIMAAGVQPHFHAIGDCAIRSALDAVAAGDPTDAARVRPHIAHIQLIDPADLPRFAELGVIANAQALWACHDETMVDLTLPRLGAHRSAWQYPFRSLADSGATLAGGSDWSVSTPNVFEQIAVAVNRQLSGEPAFLPEQALTIEEGLTMFTKGSALANHDEHRAGTIEVGKDADLVVASENPLTADDIASVEVQATFIGGEPVWIA